MRKLASSLFGLLLCSAASFAQAPPPAAPQTVEVPSGTLKLKAYLWKPVGPGPFPAVLFNHGRSSTAQLHWADGKLTLSECAERVGPLFAKHGYIFLYLFRRGEGLSADQGPFIGDLFDREAAEHGPDARDHLQVALLKTDHLADATAGLNFLKTLPEADPRRIAIVGHSFGGQLTLLMAGKAPSDSPLPIRAAVAFGPAAGSWRRSAELRDTLLGSVRDTSVPIMFVHPENDYDTAPGKALSAELDRLHKPNLLKLYPAVGKTASEGHNFLYTDTGVWESDVFRFLDGYVKK
jgi:dienelactone hydrolase